MTESESGARIGLCKECLADVPISSATSIPGHDGIYECAECGHPNSIDDFWDIYPAGAGGQKDAGQR